MNDKPQIKLSETVVLIDAAFLNFVITDIKNYFEKTLQRSLQEIDLSLFTSYLTLDAGINEGKNEVQFLFAGVPSEGMVSREDLFMDLLSVVSDSVDVKRMIVVSFNEEYGKKVTDVLQGLKGKEVMQFRMNEPEIPVNYKWDMLAFPVMHSLGIRAEEL